MSEDFIERFHFVLEQSYSLFSRVEQNMLTRSKRFNLSITELHLIEVINRDPIRGRVMGDIANELMITPSSVTIAVNKLVKKGYAVKKKGLEDGRLVYVQLTDSGRHADRIHKRFHKSLAKSITSGMTQQEKGILLNCMDRMNTFLSARLKKMEGLKS